MNVMKLAKPVKFIICGRTASGKSLFADILKHKYNMTVAESYTTRPKRNDDETGHIFINDINSVTEKRLCETEYNGFSYFITPEIVEHSDIFILDPKGMSELVAAFPNQPFRIIYMHNSDEQTRKTDFINRLDTDIAEADALYNKRQQEENECFKLFDDIFINNKQPIDNLIMNTKNIYMAINISNVHASTYKKNPDLNNTDKLADLCKCFECMDEKIYSQYKCSRRTCDVLNYIIAYDYEHPAVLNDYGLINYNHEENMATIYRTKSDKTNTDSEQYITEKVSASNFAELLCCGQDYEGIGRLMSLYFKIADTITID